jgi:hypothetical protein
MVQPAQRSEVNETWLVEPSIGTHGLPYAGPAKVFDRVAIGK